MHIIGTIIIGFLAGVVAKLLTPGRDPGGFIITTLLGIVGAFVATYLGQAIGWYRADQGAGFIGAVVGAIILLAIYHLLIRRSPDRRTYQELWRWRWFDTAPLQSHPASNRGEPRRKGLRYRHTRIQRGGAVTLEPEPDHAGVGTGVAAITPPVPPPAAPARD